MTLFSIECTTCRARLKVTSSDAIGQILACPRCQGMVQVAPPSEWIAPPLTDSQALTPVVDAPPVLKAPAQPPAPSSSDASTPWWPFAAAGATIVAAVSVGALLGYRGGDDAATPDRLPVATVSDEAPGEPIIARIPEVAPPTPAPAGPSAVETLADDEPVAAAPANEVAAQPLSPEVAPAAPATPDVVPMPLSAAEDWRRLMQMPISAISYQDVPLDRFFAIVTEMAGVECSIDREGWADDGVSPQTKIRVSAEQTTLDEVVARVVEEHRLAILVRDGQLFVTTASRGHGCATTFEVGALASATPDGATALVGLLRKFAAPESWDVAGGLGTLSAQDAKLHVVNHQQAIAECDDFLRRLEAARKLASDPASARAGALRTAWSRVTPSLDAPVSLSANARAASEIIAQLAQQAGADLRIDRLTLEAAGLSPEAPATLAVAGQPLSAALSQFVVDMRWGAWPGREGQLLLGSPQAAARRQLLEFYPVGDALSGGNAKGFMERLVAEVAPATWPSRGGRAAAYFDEPSRTLIVRQSPEVQRQLEAWLAKELAAKAKP